tara:strand:- start:85 stop:618 length:534 start_codon:yes stop_codon:yes gene_type:complete
MALFTSARDASLIRSINREIINNIIDVEVAYYKLSLEDTQANMYDESDNKVYYNPMRLNCLAMKDEKSYVGDTEYDHSRTAEFNFLRDDLKDKNIHIEEGDILEWDNEFYEIDGVGASQYWGGKNPTTDIGQVEGDVDEHGYSVAVKVTAHVTRRNRLNIQEVRSGINRPNNIPRNL